MPQPILNPQSPLVRRVFRGSLREWYAQLDRRALTFGRADATLPADQPGPLAHVQQPERAARVVVRLDRGHVEAAPAIAHARYELALLLIEVDHHLGRARVL